MEPLIALFAVTLLARFAGTRGVRYFATWPHAVRAGVAALFMLTGVAHFVGDMRADLIRMVPPVFGDAALWVTITGVAEICGAIGILIPRTTRLAAAGLILLLLAVFPANVYAIVNGVPFGGEAPEPLWFRAAEQIVFLVAVVWAGFGRSSVFQFRNRRGLPTNHT